MEIIDRLQAIAPLAGRVQGAARLADLQARNGTPQASPAAFVIGSALRGGPADVMTGMFRQALDRMVSVILFVRLAGDGTGAAGGVELEPLVEQVVTRVCGWAPEGAIGVFRLQRGELIAFAGGLATYQLDFVLDDQLRITG